MITLDASTVIAHLEQQDRHHAAASEILASAVGARMLMHSLNLAEVLVGGERAGRGREMLSDLEALGIGVAERGDDEPLELARLRATTSLALPDCCALRTALAHGSALATFNRRLAAEARRRSLRVLPAADAQ